MKQSHLMQRRPLRVLCLLLALLLAGAIFWQPQQFNHASGTLPLWQGILMIWAVCSGVINGVGFRPQHKFWQLFFAPLPSILVLLIGLCVFFI